MPIKALPISMKTIVPGSGTIKVMVAEKVFDT
jgi:hypothetical protein